jgi:hypothetical protein
MRAHRILAASLLGLALCACSARTPAQAPPVAAVGPADDQTMTIVTAAQAYVASLTPAQATASLFAYRDADQRARWSNLPVGAYERKGVKWGDLNEIQRARLMDLLNAVLSPEGVRMLADQMAADDYLLNTPDVAASRIDGPPRPDLPRGAQFGAGLYYTAILGAPSVTAPWMLQFGGHHLAINATIVGPNVTLAPSLTGGQPVTFENNRKPVHIAEREVLAAQALFDSLSPDLRAKAVMSDAAADLVLGPGRDGYTLRPEGLRAAEMTAAQKTQLQSLIETRIGLINANDAAAAMAKIRQNIDQTWFAWFGPPQAGGAYFRVSGPTIVMEFSPQGVQTGAVSNHLHNIYRDPTNDYGVAWAPIK